MKRAVGLSLVAAAMIISTGLLLSRGAGAQARQIPTFQVDPGWPKMPSKWVLGLVSGVAVDAQDHIWVLHRPKTVVPDQKDNAAPAVLEFDQFGTFIHAWCGRGAVLPRPKPVVPDQKDTAAPAVLEFDQFGTFIQAWGGPGPGYEWFDTEHGISCDNKDNVWLAGSGASDGQILKFD